MDDPIFYDYTKRSYAFKGDTAEVAGFKTREAAAKAYVTWLVQMNPKYRELVAGKRWKEVFRIVGVRV